MSITNKPTVNVACNGGGYDISGVAHLPPECSMDEAYHVLANYDHHAAWIPSVKEFTPQAAPADDGGHQHTIRMVQNVGAFTFAKDFTTMLQATPQPRHRTIAFSLLSSDLYHQYHCSFTVLQPTTTAGSTTTITGTAAPSPSLHPPAAQQAPAGLRVEYTGHFRMKVGPPPPFGRLIMPRTLHSATVTMLSHLQQHHTLAAAAAQPATGATTGADGKAPRATEALAAGGAPGDGGVALSGKDGLLGACHGAGKASPDTRTQGVAGGGRSWWWPGQATGLK